MTKYRLLFWLIMCLLMVLAGTIGLAWQQADMARTVNIKGTMIGSFFYYASWLMPLLLLLIMAGWWRKQVSLWVMLFSSAILLLGIYARFIEPNLLVVKHTQIKTGYSLKIALISDMHYGLFSTSADMQRLVNKLNTLDVDAVLVAGDWTYEPPQPIPLVDLLKPFQQVKHPIYSVTGNHDERMPGPPLAAELHSALIANGVTPIEGQSVDLGHVRVAGLLDLWAHQRQQRRERRQSEHKKQPLYWQSALAVQDKPLLLLTHNPDAIFNLPPLTQPFLVLAGHTHGGQVNLPIVTHNILRFATIGHFKRGLYTLKEGQVFVTSGIGIVGLPLRFNMPPTIDVLEFY
ncbi:metallophosphoesterase [Agitococcus lubricus]|uniref:Calcineurin-like phosphoesterase domain-containing protein n=1 Tax=Agitococcus lubricus TaxID=1077255 RepID=A0A2T5J4H9_9GAMM|nr:metallophosphoesterase [Agitococcus lubricus]PTQ91423.1 hypothetical protein C8N29_101496 [Agitococcus lubricus]